MRIAGNYTFEASRDEVWAALNNPEVLARTIPGCQRLEQVGEFEFESTLKIGLQAVKGVYSGRVAIFDQNPPQSYRLRVDGKGNNGFLKGEGTISLREDGDTTILDYGGEAQIGGTIASVGQRLLDGAAKTLINQSLKALAAQIEARRGEPPASPEAAPEVVSWPADANGASAPPATELAPVAAEPAAPTTPIAESAAPAAEPVATTSVAAPATAIAAPLPPAPTAVAPLNDTNGTRRSIVVPPHEQLSETDVARGIMDDFLKERPWFPWVVIAFLLGYLFGRRK